MFIELSDASSAPYVPANRGLRSLSHWMYRKADIKSHDEDIVTLADIEKAKHDVERLREELESATWYLERLRERYRAQ